MKKLIAGNWKMNKTITEGVSFIQEYVGKIQEKPQRGILLCVPYTMLHAVSKVTEGTNIWVGTQDVYFENEGAFTGAISPAMIKDAGATWTLVGHSERRVIFKETNEVINKKLKAALTHQITPMLCIGESLEEREAGKLEVILTTQLKEGLVGLSEEEVKKIFIAYEPVWAIGTGKTATPQDADEAHGIIRKLLASFYNEELANNKFVLYGGSVRPDNIDELIAISNVDGVLVGGSSLDVDGFARITNFTCSSHTCTCK